MPYSNYFGGVIALSWEHLDLINGLSNRFVIKIEELNEATNSMLIFHRFWGWGGEDDDIFRRLERKNLEIIRENSTIGRFQVGN